MFRSNRNELIHTRVALCVRGSRGKLVGVVVGNIGGNSTKGLGFACSCVDACKEIGGWTNVGWPAEPTSVPAVKVHGDVVEVQGLDCVLDTTCSS